MSDFDDDDDVMDEAGALARHVAEQRDEMAALLVEHTVTVNSALGMGWNRYEARCRTCGLLPGRISEAEHVSEVLRREGWRRIGSGRADRLGTLSQMASDLQHADPEIGLREALQIAKGLRMLGWHK